MSAVVDVFAHLDVLKVQVIMVRVRANRGVVALEVKERVVADIRVAHEVFTVRQ
jgi:hypothetical protein